MYKKIYRDMRFLSMLTLALTAVMIISAVYSGFSGRMRDEIRSQSLLIADLLNNSENQTETLSKIINTDKRITLIAPDGRVLFDNNIKPDELGDHNSRPEINSAREKGFGESQRFSSTSKSNVYYYAVLLSEGNVLRVAGSSSSVWKMFTGIIAAVLFTAVMVYFLSAVIASRLTGNIVRPIDNISLFDETDNQNIYEEIRPFLKRISKQNSEIKRQIEVVNSQRAQLGIITDNMNEGLAVIDGNGNTLLANTRATSLLKGEIKNSVTLTEGIEKALKGEKSSFIEPVGDKSYQIFLNPVVENGVISGAVMLFIDVSDKAEAEQIRKEFSANVSHELKTPVTAIHGYAQLITKGIAKQEDVNGFAQRIEKESARLITLIDDIIKLSNIDEGVSGEYREISLMAVVQNVAESLKMNSEKRNVTVITDGKDSIIRSDLSQVTEMIYNLCDNAIKYNVDGGTVRVTVGDKTVTVADTGIGIPGEYKERIFERFFRVDKSHSKKVNGTGLGLSIVKNTARNLKAEISVESEPGNGSVFTVRFLNA